jgi:hypothetical protein
MNRRGMRLLILAVDSRLNGQRASFFLRPNWVAPLRPPGWSRPPVCAILVRASEEQVSSREPLRQVVWTTTKIIGEYSPRIARAGALTTTKSGPAAKFLAPASNYAHLRHQHAPQSGFPGSMSPGDPP